MTDSRDRGLLSSLIRHEKVVTTEARAKVLKQEVERLISRSKKLDLSARRRVLGILPEKDAATKLFERIVPQFMDRVGGYVRVIKLGHRRGDQAPLARVEFVEKIKEQVKKVKEVKGVKRVRKVVKRKASEGKNVRNKSNFRAKARKEGS